MPAWRLGAAGAILGTLEDRALYRAPGGLATWGTGGYTPSPSTGHSIVLSGLAHLRVLPGLIFLTFSLFRQKKYFQIVF